MTSTCATARMAAAAAVATACAALAGCTSPTPVVAASTTPIPSTASSTVVSTSTPDPSVSAAAAALAAYRGYRAALATAKRTADLTSPALARFAQDKALAQARATLLEMQRLGIVYRGEPSISPAVVRVDTAAARPTVVVEDCVDNSNWKPIYKSSGKSAAAPDQQARVPAVASVQLYAGLWRVFDVQADRSRTC